jgi:hypothetical protein
MTTTSAEFYAVTPFSQSKRCTESEAWDVAAQWQSYGYPAAVIPAACLSA